MNNKKFMALLTKKKIGIAINTDIVTTVEKINTIILENYDFGCNFKDGQCRMHKTLNPKCCCIECAEYIGYFTKRIPEKWIDILAKLYNVKLGFWTSSGCSLPKHIRSCLCIEHSCISHPNMVSFGFRVLALFWKQITHNDTFLQSEIYTTVESFKIIFNHKEAI